MRIFCLLFALGGAMGCSQSTPTTPVVLPAPVEVSSKASEGDPTPKPAEKSPEIDAKPEEESNPEVPAEIAPVPTSGTKPLFNPRRWQLAFDLLTSGEQQMARSIEAKLDAGEWPDRREVNFAWHGAGQLLFAEWLVRVAQAGAIPWKREIDAHLIKEARFTPGEQIEYFLKPDHKLLLLRLKMVRGEQLTTRELDKVKRMPEFGDRLLEYLKQQRAAPQPANEPPMP